MAGANQEDSARSYEFERPWMYPKQEQAIFCPERIAIIEGSTKCGKTIGMMIWLLEMALTLGQENRHFYWIAPVYNQAKIAYNRFKAGLPKEMYRFHDTDMTLTLPNGGILTFRGADKPDTIYGDDGYAVVIDEASRMKPDAWHAVRSITTATRGQIRIIGNVKGRKNWFFRLARQAENGARDMRYTKITAFDAAEAGVIDWDEIRGAKEVLPDSVFKELYLAEASDDGGNPFGLKHIRACTIPSESTGVPLAWGWDLAKSQDWTVGTALDERGRVCRFERWQSSYRVTVPRIIDLTKSVPALVDQTGVGAPVVEELQEATPGTFEGYVISQQSKQRLMDGLALAIQRHELSIPAGIITAELESFEYHYTRTGVLYEAPEGEHDDCVMSLALAVMHWRKRSAGDIAASAAPDTASPISPQHVTSLDGYIAMRRAIMESRRADEEEKRRKASGQVQKTDDEDDELVAVTSGPPRYTQSSFLTLPNGQTVRL